MSDDQFKPRIAMLTTRAAEEAAEMSRKFSSLEATAQVLIGDARELRDEVTYGRSGWANVNAGVAAALAGQPTDAEEMLTAVLRDSTFKGTALFAAAERFANVAAEPGKVEQLAMESIAQQRSALRLPALIAPPF